jgi:hypothetical protein
MRRGVWLIDFGVLGIIACSCSATGELGQQFLTQTQRTRS